MSVSERLNKHVVQNGTLTAKKYADEIFRYHVVPHAKVIVELFLLIHFNTRPHTSQLV